MERISSHWQRCFRYSWLLTALCWLAACNPAASTPAATQVSVVVEETAVPTNTPAPANTPLPTASHTAEPTATSLPTTTNTATAATTATATAAATHIATATTAASATPAPTATATQPPIPTNTPRPPATATTSAPDLTIGNLAERMGQEVTISGTVVNTASFSGGFRFRLSDGTGEVTLLMWHNVYDDCWDAPQLNRGATVEATGEVGTFEGELQIVPDFGGDVRVTAAGGPFAPAREIGELGNHLGELVQITGQINRLESTSSGPKIFVADDSGEIVVFVWNNILDRVPGNVALGVPGTRVRVVGAVQEFRSNREIVPALPYDIEVLP